MFSLFRDADQLQAIEAQLVEMLASCQDAYRLATSAAFGEADTVKSGMDLLSLDKDINRMERRIRRELLIHGTVRGAEVDQGLMLTYMSLAKDIERIGDKCKDIWELAQMGANLSVGESASELQRDRERIAKLIEETLNAFTSEDSDKVHELVQGIQNADDYYDQHVQKFVMSTFPSKEVAPRALFYRYIKRLSAHLANILSSVVMPVDRLDFYNPEKAIEEAEGD